MDDTELFFFFFFFLLIEGFTFSCKVLSNSTTPGLNFEAADFLCDEAQGVHEGLHPPLGFAMKSPAVDQFQTHISGLE